MRHILFAAILSLLSSPAFAEVILVERIEYYLVGGATKQEIHEELQNRSPHKKNGVSYPAYTRTNIKSQYTTARKGNRCTVKDVKIHLTLTYVYPKLARAQSMQVRQWWSKAMNKIRIHEELHGDISKEGAAELDREMRAMRDVDCSTIKAIMKARFNAVFKRLKAEQEKYDYITKHGRHQERYHK